MTPALHRKLIEAVAGTVIRHADELTALDRAIGDGDHGLSMKRGFEAVLAEIDKTSALATGEALKAVGMALVMKVVLGWNINFSIWVSSITVALYVALGGLRSAIFNEVLQFVLIWLGAMLISIIGLIEGILYLTKSDADFVATYVNGKKGWF